MRNLDTALIVKLSEANDRVLERVKNVLQGSCDGDASCDRLLKFWEARKILSVSRSTLWRMIKQQQLAMVEIIPGMKRIRASDLQRLVEKGVSNG